MKLRSRKVAVTLAEIIIICLFIGISVALIISEKTQQLKQDKEQRVTDRLDEFNKTVRIEEDSTNVPVECTSFTIEVRNGNVKVRCE